MKTKLISSLLLGASFLYAGSIVGSWSLDMAKAKALQDSYSNNMQMQFFIGMIAEATENINFKKDGSCEIGANNVAKCWKKVSSSSYILYEEDGSYKGNKVKVLGANRLKLIIANPKLSFSYKKMGKSFAKAPKVSIKKGKLYHAKNIVMKDFHVKGSGFFIFTGKNRYFHLATERFNSLTLQGLKRIKAKCERHKGGFLLKGAYQVNEGKYMVKKGAYYTDFDPFSDEFDKKRIEVINRNHIKFNGYDYYLEE